MAKTNSTWKAWVNTMPPQKGGQLHVEGDFLASEDRQYKLEAAVPQGINPRILLLKINPEPQEGDKKFHVTYEAHLNNPLQFDEVQIIKPAQTIKIDQIS